MKKVKLTYLDKEGYFATGDICNIKNGIIKLNGRVRDIIKKGGFLIQLREIEERCKIVDGIDDIAAVPVQDDFMEKITFYFCKILLILQKIN